MRLAKNFLSKNFQSTFSPCYTTTPVVTLARMGSSAATMPPSLWLTGATTAGFTGRYQGHIEPVKLSTVAHPYSYFSLNLLSGGLPCVAYRDSTWSDLMFAYSYDLQGVTWGTFDVGVATFKLPQTIPIFTLPRYIRVDTTALERVQTAGHDQRYRVLRCRFSEAGAQLRRV